MLEDAKLHYVDSAEEAAAFVQWAAGIANRSAPVAIDTETTGLKWWTPRFTRLLQLGIENEAWAVDIERWRGAAEQALAYLVAARCSIIMHNAAFDMHALEADGFPVPQWVDVHDTKLAHHLIIPHAAHSLKPMSASYFGNEVYKGQGELDARAKELGYSKADKWALINTREPSYWVYACMDTILTFRAAQLIFRELRAIGMVPQYEAAMAYREVMYRAESRGLIVDGDWTSDLRESWIREAVLLADQLEAAGIQNPLSNKQVTEALEDLEWEPDEFTPTGAAKLDKVILSQLSAARPEWAHVADKILRYRRITKWISGYLDPFLNELGPDGRLHFSVNVFAARTGRDSIQHPAMQTLPSRDEGAWQIRRCIMPSIGNHIWAVDYNSQEARSFAHYSQDPGMLACIRRGDDLYRFAAEVIYGDTTITKNDPRRGLTKVNLLAFSYGAGVDKLSKTSGLSTPETEQFIRRLFQEFPNVRDLTGDHSIGGDYPGSPAIVAAERGAVDGLRYVLTKSGRRFSVPSDDELYKCVNGLMQGSGADILHEAVIRLDQLGYGDTIMLPVHDELLFDLPAGVEGEYAAREVQQIMEDHSMSVPITTELTGPLDSWGRKYMPEAS